MNDTLPRRIDAEWRRLVARLGWTFVEYEDALLAQVLAALHESHGAAPVTATHIGVELQQHYNRRLYAAFMTGRLYPGDEDAVRQTNRACREIWYAAWRQVRAKGHDEQTAADVAQRVVTQLIEKPNDVRVPGSLSAWVMWKVLGILSALQAQRVEDSIDPETGDSPEVQDLNDPLERLEDDALAREIIAELPRLLSPFQEQVIRLVVLAEHSHKYVADRLGVRETQVIVEKSRALQRIRKYISRQMPP